MAPAFAKSSADQKHDLALTEAGATRGEQSVLVHSAEAMDSWVCGLRRRYAGKLVAVCSKERYLEALRKRNAPSSSSTTNPPPSPWKTRQLPVHNRSKSD